MQLIRLEAAVMLGIVIQQMFNISMSSPSSDCSASVETGMPHLCKSERAFYGCICGDEGCQIKGSEVCNMTIQTILDQFPSLQECVCAWEEELCDSIQALATQCHPKPAAQQKRRSVTDWQSSSLIGNVYDGVGSCMDQIAICISDVVCNKYLIPVLQACKAEHCDRDHCLQIIQQFYGSMPRNVAEMLVMCECEASDQDCVNMRSILHSGACGDEAFICQETVNRCVKDSNCRDLLKNFQTKCWSTDDTQCSDSELQNGDCFTQMDPAIILGADPECKMAFLATMGTALHYPCTCNGVLNDDLLTCNMIHNVLHNRSNFMTSWKSSSGPSKPPEMDEYEQGHTWPHDYLLYAFTTVLLVGVVVLMPLAVISKIWMFRRRDKTKFHHPQKSNCVVVL
ncbi:hypothetical protein D5F01_LYC21672 [Larimichthys crocea]|uniref:GDNF/GAS1 domain-containing protein n=1 Tax=Larimichthys crocea TaxID=215358 RepID=A0A6G0HJX6_LARCR|nr:hypothetical protein D5F01_LYC21672 [Larimichthys crocea]